MLTRNEDGTYTNALIDKNSGGFEHATHAADLDGDGKLGSTLLPTRSARFAATFGLAKAGTVEIDDIPMHITWNLQDGVL